jgi:hypothetical protein
MNRYLVETNYTLDDDHQLHVFDDIELMEFLSGNIQRLHYSGDGYDIKYIAQYLGNGKLRRLQLRPMGEHRDANDYLDWSYELVSAGRTDLGDDPELTEMAFTVRIDGRA